MIRTRRGTRPGDSWADVVFNVLCARVLRAISQELNAMGLLSAVTAPVDMNPMGELDPQQHVQLCHITWADDIALLLAPPLPSMIPHYLAQGTKILAESMARYGMMLSMGPKKTAALVLPRGKSAVKVKRQLFNNKDASFPVLCEHCAFEIPMVSSYVHLGGVIASDTSLLHELRARAAKAWSAYKKASKSVFRNRQLDVGLRYRLFQATVLSMWWWGAGAWPLLNDAEFAFYERTTWKLYRALWLPPLGTPAYQVSHAELQIYLNVLKPADYLKEARLRHLGLFIAHAPLPIRTIVRHDVKAQQATQEAMDWMAEALGNDFELTAATPWEQWQQIILDRPSRWKRLVTTAAKRWMSFQIERAKVDLWHRDIAGILQIRHLSDEKEANGVQHYCLLCSKPFGSWQQWFMHAAVCHEYRSPSGRAAIGQVCLCCAKKYPSNRALQHHLRYSDSCRSFFLLHHFEVTTMEADHPQMPWTHHGIPISNDLPAFDPDRTLLVDDLWTTWSSLEPTFDFDNLNSAFLGMSEVLCRALPLVTIQEALDLWSSAQQLPRHQECFQQLLGRLHQPLDLDVSTEDQRRKYEATPFCPQPWTYLPRSMFFLHFFSGRRRPGDLQTALDECVVPDGCQLFTLSIDVQVSATLCDLSNVSQQRQWLQLIADGLVAGCAVGPPCETWTKARSAKVEGMTRPPRPLRERADPWGILARSMREWKQIGMGNTLMLWALRASLGQALMDSFSVLEHPEDPHNFCSGEESHPSIWGTMIIQWFSRRDFSA